MIESLIEIDAEVLCAHYPGRPLSGAEISWYAKVEADARLLPWDRRMKALTAGLALAHVEAVLEADEWWEPLTAGLTPAHAVSVLEARNANGYVALLRGLYHGPMASANALGDVAAEFNVLDQFAVKALEALLYVEVGLGWYLETFDMDEPEPEHPLLEQRWANRYLEDIDSTPAFRVFARPAVLLDAFEACVTIGQHERAVNWLKVLLHRDPDEYVLIRLLEICGAEQLAFYADVEFPSIDALLTRPADGYDKVRSALANELDTALGPAPAEFEALVRSIGDVSAGTTLEFEPILWKYYCLAKLKEMQPQAPETSRLCKRFLAVAGSPSFVSAAAEVGASPVVSTIRPQLKAMQAELDTLPIPGQNAEFEKVLTDLVGRGWTKLSKKEQQALAAAYKDYRIRRKYGISLEGMQIHSLGVVLEQVLARQIIHPLGLIAKRPPTTSIRDTFNRIKELFGHQDFAPRTKRVFGAKGAFLVTKAFQDDVNKAIEIRHKGAHSINVAADDVDRMFTVLLAPGQVPGSGLLAQILSLAPQ